MTTLLPPMPLPHLEKGCNTLVILPLSCSVTAPGFSCEYSGALTCFAGSLKCFAASVSLECIFLYIVCCQPKMEEGNCLLAYQLTSIANPCKGLELNE